MKEGGFVLRKWTTNMPELQRKIDENEQFLGEEVESSDAIKSVLGVQWNTKSDNFMFSIELCAVHELDVTKRSILKTISSVFDPLGVLAPVVINLKLLFQELCKENCSWDEKLSEELVHKWNILLKRVHGMKPIVIPRYYLLGIAIDNIKSVELHGFADASGKAYAGVGYLRIRTEDGNFVRFLAAKTREKHNNETLRLCSEFQRRQSKKRAYPGRGQQTRIKYCHNFIF